MTRYLLFPFRSTVLVLLVTFTIGWWLVLKSVLTGFLLGIILISWFFKYCFVLLDAIVAGHDEPPVLSVEMVNPVDEQRPLAQAAIITAGVVLVRAVNQHVGQAAAIVSGSLLLFALPASVAVLGVTGNPFRAVWPPALMDIARAGGHRYVLVHISMFAGGALVYALLLWEPPLWVLFAAVQLWFLLAFSLVGGVVFEHRHELGIETRTRQEREAERTQREHVLERNRMLDHAYAKFKARQPLEGWKDMEAWLAPYRPGANVSDNADDTLLIEQAALLESASSWDDVRPGDRLASDLIAGLLARKQTGKALEVLEKRLASNPRFRPAHADHAARLAELASAAGKPALRRKLES